MILATVFFILGGFFGGWLVFKNLDASAKESCRAQIAGCEIAAKSFFAASENCSNQLERCINLLDEVVKRAKEKAK